MQRSVLIAGASALVVLGSVLVVPRVALAAAPRASVVNLLHTFDRNDPNGFGVAMVGGGWTFGSTGSPNISGRVGHTGMVSGTATAGTIFTAEPQTGVLTDEDLSMSFSFDTLPAAGSEGVYYGLQQRRQTNGDAYIARVKVLPGGTAQVSIVRNKIGFGQNRYPDTPEDGPTIAISTGHGYTLDFEVAGSGPVSLYAVLRDTDTAAVLATVKGSNTSGDGTIASGTTAIWMNATANSAGSMNVTEIYGAATDGTGVRAAAGNVGALTPQSQMSPPQSVPNGNTVSPNGDWVINTPGLYTGTVVSGFVRIAASNVTLRDVRVLGRALTSDEMDDCMNKIKRPLIAIGSGSTLVQGTRITDSTLVSSVPSVCISAGITAGVLDSGTSVYTALRVDISATIDGFRPQRAGGTFVNSFVHDLIVFDNDPGQPDKGLSHNDAVQTEGAPDVLIAGNTLSATCADRAMAPVYTCPNPTGGPVRAGSGIQTGEKTDVGFPQKDLIVAHNFFEHGGDQVNVYTLDKVKGQTFVRNRFDRTATGNTMGPLGRFAVGHCNVYDDTGVSVPYSPSEGSGPQLCPL